MADVIICRTCKGTGVVPKRSDTDISKYLFEKCNTCKGSGRMYVRSYTLEVAFPDKDSKELYRADNQMMKVINSVKEQLYGNTVKPDE